MQAFIALGPLPRFAPLGLATECATWLQFALEDTDRELRCNMQYMQLSPAGSKLGQTSIGKLNFEKRSSKHAKDNPRIMQ